MCLLEANENETSYLTISDDFGFWHQVYNCETLRLVLVGPQVRC
jgi:hypothetical protein